MDIDLITTAPPPRPARPLANPDLFKPTPSTPGATGSARKVSFQAGPPSEIRSATPPTKSERKPSPAGGKSSKWEPLSAVEPSPTADNDPFSLGDSDDDREVTKPKNATVEDEDKVQKAAAEAMGEDIAKPVVKERSESQTKSAT